MDTKSIEVAKNMLADSKFYMGYSMFDETLGRYENWGESVGRVMDMHRKKYAHVMTPELEEYISIAQEAYLEKAVLGSQRALQFGGEQIFKHESRMYNCLGKETKFVTNLGIRSFEDFEDGDIVTVMTHLGNWKQAVVRNYGKQQLNEVTVSKGVVSKKIRATANHRWILKDGSETTDLKVGDNIYKEPKVFEEFNWETAPVPEKLYWCYGFVYGDGTLNNGYSLVRLCGSKRAYEERFKFMGFGSSSSLSLGGDAIIYTGSYQKNLPDPKLETPEMLRAFIAGYLAADGHRNNNLSGKQYLGIQSSNPESIKFIEEVFPVAGVHVIGTRDLTGRETNYGIRGITKSFTTCDSSGSKYNSGWSVKSINTTTDYEDVWCLEVEDDHSFVLEGGIVTGNCSSTYADRPRFFQEAMYLLLCGCGVGFSVQKHHVAKLPKITKPDPLDSKVYVVEDSIEGWSDAVGVLLSSYLVDNQEFPEYAGKTVHFDFSKIRPRGAFITGGFKAPGSDGLNRSLEKCRELLSREVKDGGEIDLRPIVVYDFVMHSADAVLSGGIRRAATICIFSKDDEEMLTAKTGNWFIENPQRGRSNNSALLIRNELTREEWADIMRNVKEFGEPGFIFADFLEALFNPCVEIGMMGYTESGESGWQKCNLVELSGTACTSREALMKAAYAGAILGTLQAGYTNFTYLTQASIEITEREALLGVSITGWMTNPDVLFNVDNMRDAAHLVKEVNRKVAKLIGINQAARTTAVKPSGNASVLLRCASGIHGDHAPRYFRNVQMNTQDAVTSLITKTNPKMVEDSAWSQNKTDVVISFPIVASEGSIFKKFLLGIKQLEYVKLAQQVWVEEGTNVELCVHPSLRHNVSNTISVDDWDEVEQYIFDNREHFAGISLMSSSGDRAYVQAPFTEVFTSDQILEMYGPAAMFASGLIVDGCHAFNNNLWTACDTALGFGKTLSEDDSSHLLMRDWVRRAKKFAKTYFAGDLLKMTFCLKDVHNLHKWEGITRSLSEINFSSDLDQQVYTEIDTMGAQGCNGGACEISFN